MRKCWTYVMFILLFAFITPASVLQAQTPYKVLDKAEKLYQKGKYDKALQKIIVVENMHYCTCGTCYLQLRYKLNLLRHSIYKKMEKHELSRQTLDSISNRLDYWFGPNYSINIDSLKALSYQKEYGELVLSLKIDSAILNATLDSSTMKSEYISYVNLPINDTLQLRFKVDKEFFQSKDEFGRNRWIVRFKESQTYSMLKSPNLKVD